MLSIDEIRNFIIDDITSERKRFASVGQKYYEAEHDILKCRLFYFNGDGKLVEDKFRSNIRICHPFFTELCDQLSSYVLSFDENPIRAKETAEGLQEELDAYFGYEFWAEIEELITGAYAKGFDYIYAYKNVENRLTFQQADGMGVVEVRAKDTDDGCEYVIYWYIDRIEKGRKPIKRIQVWSETETWFYVQDGNDEIILDESEKINPRPHVIYKDKKSGKRMGYPLGYIPFWRLDNNKKRTSGIKPIKALIDDYDLMQCGLSNNLTDFDTPLHVVSGYEGDNLDELQQNLKTKKIVSVAEGGNVHVQTVDIPYQARQAKAADDEKNIYRFGMGLNTSGLKDTAATTNIAIKAAYSLLDMKANKMEKRLIKLLKDIIKVVLAEINNEKGTDYQMKDISFDFTRSVMTNETENIQNRRTEEEIKQIQVTTILNVAANVGDEQTLKAICEVMDWSYDELKGQIALMQEEKNAAGAMATLEGAATDE